MGKNRYYCRYKGIVYNMHKLQELIDAGDRGSMEMTYTLVEEYGIDPMDALMFEEVLKFNNYEIPADYDEALKEYRIHNADKRKLHCPYCHSTDVKKITFTHWAFGRQWHCNNCNSDF